MKKLFKVGDILEWSCQRDVVIEIMGVRGDGTYVFRYMGQEREYLSADSSDPFLQTYVLRKGSLKFFEEIRDLINDAETRAGENPTIRIYMTKSDLERFTNECNEYIAEMLRKPPVLKGDKVNRFMGYEVVETDQLSFSAVQAKNKLGDVVFEARLIGDKKYTHYWEERV